MKNIIVTGGCGFIGSHLVDKLVELGHNVLVIDDLSQGKQDHCNAGADYIFGDFKKEMQDAKDQTVDIIFHLAACARIQPSFEEPLYTQENNAYGTAIAGEFARKSGAMVILAGSSSCYADTHATPYTFSKWQSEEVLKMYSRLYNLQSVITRFFNVYGPRNPLIGSNTPVIALFEKQKAAGKPLTIVGTGEQRRDFTHVYDICEGLIKISQKSWHGETFNLGTGVNYSMNELADLFESEKKYIPLRKGEAKNVLADISRTTELTGWIPQYSLVDYIKSIILKENKELINVQRI